MKRKEIVKLIIEKSTTQTKKTYEAGAIDALSIAVNIFNCPDYIREGVFKKMNIKL